MVEIIYAIFVDAMKLFKSNIFLFFFCRMDIDQKNPWIVSEVEQFLFFCCPECDVKDRSKESFIQHALSHHPNAKKGLSIDNLVKEEFAISEKKLELGPKLPAKVKEEILDQNNYNDNYYLDQTMEEYPENPYDHEINNDYLEQSMEEYSENPLYECGTCKIGLNSSSELKFHVRQDHDKFETYNGYSCKFCNEHFAYWPGLLHHIGEFHEEKTKEKIKTEKTNNVHEGSKKDHNNKIHNCNICGKSYSKLGNLKIHMSREHENSDEDEADVEGVENNPNNIRKKNMKKCPKCGKLVSRLSLKNTRHYKKCSGVDSELMHKCTICEKSYLKLGNLKSHMSKDHDIQMKENDGNLADQKVQCDQCEKTFTTNERLKTHVKYVHEKADESFCDLCGKSFSREMTLKTHIRVVHEGKKDHVCEVCTKTFSVRCNLVQHIKMVHEKQRNHVCDECKFAQFLNFQK